mmetsp:Transcript_28309/g.53542  ORF Transcript_28309/g.53542 Transcript_28309/m.53542 type:complete len:207 (+) Transcript_28309:551-1171(+)
MHAPGGGLHQSENEPRSLQHESCGHKEHPVPCVESVPDARHCLGHHQRAEAWLFPWGLLAVVHVVPQPVAGADVPVERVLDGARGQLHPERTHVLAALPHVAPRGSAQVRSAGALECRVAQTPAEVVLEPRLERHHVHQHALPPEWMSFPLWNCERVHRKVPGHHNVACCHCHCHSKTAKSCSHDGGLVLSVHALEMQKVAELFEL